MGTIDCFAYRGLNKPCSGTTYRVCPLEDGEDCAFYRSLEDHTASCIAAEKRISKLSIGEQIRIAKLRAGVVDKYGLNQK